MHVPTQLHEVLVEMFRARPELARELLVMCAHVDVPDGACEAASVDLSQAVPSEYRADAVTVIRASGEAKTAVVVEVQLRVDPDKAWTWPLYVVALRARLRCPSALLVLVPDDVAAWARRPIALGHPGFTLQPTVIAFSELPRITSADEAARAPEIAVLSVLAHPDLAVAKAALEAVQELDEDPRRLYLDLILNALSAALRHTLEVTVLKNYKFQSDFFVRHERAGRHLGLCDAASELIRVKTGEVTVDQRELLESTGDEALLRLVTDLAAAPDRNAVLDVIGRLIMTA